MSYVQAAALITRLGEVLGDSRGLARTIPVGRFSTDYPEGLAESEQIRRAYETPRVRVDVQVLGRSKYSPPINGNLVIYDVRVIVTLLRAVEREAQIIPEMSNALTAAVLEDADVIRQALEYPRNLETTEAGEATDLVSGMLSYDAANFAVLRTINQGAQKYETKIPFIGWLITRPAVT